MTLRPPPYTMTPQKYWQLEATDCLGMCSHESCRTWEDEGLFTEMYNKGLEASLYIPTVSMKHVERAEVIEIHFRRGQVERIEYREPEIDRGED